MKAVACAIAIAFLTTAGLPAYAQPRPAHTYRAWKAGQVLHAEDNPATPENESESVLLDDTHLLTPRVAWEAAIAADAGGKAECQAALVECRKQKNPAPVKPNRAVTAVKWSVICLALVGAFALGRWSKE